MALVNPATGAVHGSAPRSGPSDTDAACTAAQAALDGWSLTTPAQRQRALLGIAEAIEAHADALVAAEVGDTGKPPGRFRSEELPAVTDTFRFFAGAARNLPGRPPPSTPRAAPRCCGANRSGSAPRSPPGTTR